jgi:hypothetical protein
MQLVGLVIALNGVPYHKMMLVVSHITSDKKKEGKKETISFELSSKPEMLQSCGVVPPTAVKSS